MNLSRAVNIFGVAGDVAPAGEGEAAHAEAEEGARAAEGARWDQRGAGPAERREDRDPRRKVREEGEQGRCRRWIRGSRFKCRMAEERYWTFGRPRVQRVEDLMAR